MDKRDIRTTILAAVAFGLAVASHAGAQVASSPPPAWAAVHSRLERLVASDSTPSIVVGVAKEGRIVLEEAFGWADKEHRRHATPQMSYAIASVTKTLTATEVMALATQGRLAIDKPANAYLAQLPDSIRIKSNAWNVNGVTVHRLANHTGGLPTHAILCFADATRCDASIPQAIARYAIAIRLPGERFDYSNLGYGVLGTIVERVARRPFAAAMQRGVFDPLGLVGTFIGPSRGRANVAASYTGSGVRVEDTHSSTPGASDGYASVDDLLKFGLFHLHFRSAGQTQIIPDSVIDWMQTATVRADSHNRYGFGWWVDNDHDGIREVYAAGGTSVASALLLLVPAERLVVAVVANTGLPLADIGDDVIGAFVPAFANKRAAANAAAHAGSEQTRQSAQPIRPLQELVGSWSGEIVTYAGTVPIALTIDSLGRVEASVGSTHSTISDASYSADGRMFARLRGALPVNEFHGRPYHLDTELAVHGNRLTGYVTGSLDSNAAEGIALTYWADLQKQP
jgi:CubicO group peptidase (beta-lactamase class C family)